jgi:2-amino-4-hydroxy-6-hydroxymethyldihydropteridine diphosphokinase
MSKVYILLGTNLGNKRENLIDAINRIHQSGQIIIKESGVYETAPWGFQHPENFYNQVIAIETYLAPEKLMQTLLTIETDMGRSRKSANFEARIIDIDILLFDNLVITSEIVTIPHPRMHLRRFTLVPLCEIAPSIIHPVLKCSINTLLLHCRDTSSVEKLDF